jgi:hypothetical protein
VDEYQKDPIRSDLFSVLASGRALLSFCNALIRGKSEIYTDDQLKALKDLHITPNLHINLPKAKPHSLDKALHQGQVDRRTCYYINLGSSTLTTLNKVPSANVFLQSTYVLFKDNQHIKKATCDQLNGAVCKVKEKLRDTPVRQLLKPLFDDLLGLGDLETLKACLTHLKVKDELIQRFLKICTRSFIDDDQTVEGVSELQKALSKGIDSLFATYVQPLVFYIGCTGLIPEQFKPIGYKANEIKDKYPRLKTTPTEEEALFFDLNQNTLLSIYTKEVFFSQ